MKQICLILIISALTFPLIEHNINIIEEEAFNGVYKKNEEPKLFLKNWLTGEYQKDYSLYLNDTIGLRKTMVRFYNQYSFSLFNKANSKNTIIGGDDILFNEVIIEAYLGNDFVGEKKLNELAWKYKQVQQDLASKNILLLTVIAPGKASYMKKELPTKYNRIKKKKNNYEHLSQELEKVNANVIDLSKFLSNVNSKHPLYPKNGTHWSGYSTALTFEIIQKYIEKKIKKKLKGYTLDGGETTTTELRYTDNDIADAMNMMSPIENYDMYYPNVVFEEGKFYRPNTLIIGDSYAQSYYGFYPFYETVFSPESNLWYYNRIVLWPYQGSSETSVSNLNIKEDILSRDVIIFFTSEENVKNLGFGFLEEYDYIMNESKSPREEAILNISRNIKSNSEKMKQIKKQALERNQTIEQTIRANAVYVYNSAGKGK
jgi:hypothetical protein